MHPKWSSGVHRHLDLSTKTVLSGCFCETETVQPFRSRNIRMRMPEGAHYCRCRCSLNMACVLKSTSSHLMISCTTLLCGLSIWQHGLHAARVDTSDVP